MNHCLCFINQGYSHLLGKVFEDAGLILSTEQHKELKKQAEVKDQSAPLLPSDEQLSNLGSCQEVCSNSVQLKMIYLELC